MENVKLEIKTKLKPFRKNFQESRCADKVDLVEVTEGPAVPARLESDQCECHWQNAEE